MHEKLFYRNEENICLALAIKRLSVFSKEQFHFILSLFLYINAIIPKRNIIQVQTLKAVVLTVLFLDFSDS